jgi:hypothetical protein
MAAQGVTEMENAGELGDYPETVISPPLVGAWKNWLEKRLIRTGNLRENVDNIPGT